MWGKSPLSTVTNDGGEKAALVGLFALCERLGVIMALPFVGLADVRLLGVGGDGKYAASALAAAAEGDLLSSSPPSSRRPCHSFSLVRLANWRRARPTFRRSCLCVGDSCLHTASGTW
jgi:hypothetical protein